MRIYGLDFTSAPNARKSMTLAVCELQETHLELRSFERFFSFAAFETWLRSPAPWLAALDFPFGLPRKFLTNVDWPLVWEEYVSLAAEMGKEEFESTIHSYRLSRVPGDKHHLRAVDVLAQARSPLMLYRVPVGKMFFQGAPRLLHAPVSILPCRPSEHERIVLEGYPALVARRFLQKGGYKSDGRGPQNVAHSEARRNILEGLGSPAMSGYYGLTVEIPPALTLQLIDDPQGDLLDAALCAVQAAWAWTRRETGYGIPADCDSLEGYIVDALTLRA